MKYGINKIIRIEINGEGGQDVNSKPIIIPKNVDVLAVEGGRGNSLLHLSSQFPCKEKTLKTIDKIHIDKTN